MVNYSSPILIILTVLLTSSCANKKTELAWEQNFPLIGTQSSPRATDLNNDGIKDIVIGAGRAELDSTPHGVIALDGDTGEALWIKSTQAQIVGSASFIDITNDGIQDVFIGGRNHILKAIDGSSGDLIWEYQNESLDDPNLLYARYNFYSSCVIPDKNNNGYPELLTINGGNWEAKPNDNGERFPGVLMLIDSKDGNVIAADTMPDGKESYMSPISFKQTGSNQLNILIGTGGETIGGNLYLTSLDDLINDNLESAQLLLSEPEHGFIAPPSLADINNDKVLDFLIATHSANLIAVDGSNFETLWQHSFKGYECSSSFTVGQFTDDEVPDAFTIISNGVWPDYSHGLHLMINGSTGEVEYKKSLGCYSLSTPVAYDLTKDGIDEVIMSVNKYDCNIDFFEDVKGDENISNMIVALDLTSSVVQEIDNSPRFRNTFGSPWIGDLDDDGYLDIVYAQNYDPEDLFRVRGMRMKRISSSISMKDKNVAWGEYLGASGKGIYKKD